MATQPDRYDDPFTPIIKIGRPTLKTAPIVQEIVERLSHGEPLAQICDDERMPSFMTVLRWETEDPVFRNLSVRARLYGTHYIADDCMRIADNPELDPKDKRVRIDTRLRLIGKWNAKVYGDSTMLKHADANGEAIRSAIDPTLLSPDERDTLRQLILASQQRALAPPEEAEYEEIGDEEE